MNKNIRDIIIKIILIIVIIVLLIHNCCLIKNIKKENESNSKVPTGNVDIFEINCDKDNCDDKSVIDNTFPIDNNSIPSSGIIDNDDKKEDDKGDKDEEDEKEPEELIIKDKDITWESTNKLRIFTNPVYDIGEKIAPESSNIYQFIIKNNTTSKIKYSVSFVETNSYNINMKYKLKRNNDMLINEYSNYSNLNQSNIEIDPGASHTYYLDWKWFGTENDNDKAGIIDAYDLSIKIEAEAVNE